MRVAITSLIFAMLSSGCMVPYTLQMREPEPYRPTRLTVANSPPPVAYGGGPQPAATMVVSSAPPASPYAVQVYVDKKINRPCVVVGVLDFHSDANSEDKGFDQLRVRAAALGADAVIGAEFEHGDDGGPSHLSGMAVRFLDQ